MPPSSVSWVPTMSTTPSTPPPADPATARSRSGQSGPEASTSRSARPRRSSSASLAASRSTPIARAPKARSTCSWCTPMPPPAPITATVCTGTGPQPLGGDVVRGGDGVGDHPRRAQLHLVRDAHQAVRRHDRLLGERAVDGEAVVAAVAAAQRLATRGAHVAAPAQQVEGRGDAVAHVPARHPVPARDDGARELVPQHARGAAAEHALATVLQRQAHAAGGHVDAHLVRPGLGDGSGLERGRAPPHSSSTIALITAPLTPAHLPARRAPPATPGPAAPPSACARSCST